MKQILFLLALALPLTAQEGFDFHTLDKLGTNAKNKTNITLDGDMLKMASGFLGGADKDTQSIKPLVDSLTGIYVRSFEYAKEGQYNEGDLEPLRAFLKQGKWNRIVESREEKASSEVYLLPKANSRLGGVAIISAEPKQVSVVYISGDLKQEDIAKLSGNMGIPEIKSDLLEKKAQKSAKGKKDEDE
jgi:hypothetical protein